MDFKDLEQLQQYIDFIIKIMKRYFTLPFLFLLGAGSRVFYEYLQNKKMPTARETMAIVVLAAMSCTATSLLIDALGYDKKWLSISVLTMAFLGHTSATWLLENWKDYIPFKKK